jgi:hypothetical protein
LVVKCLLSLVGSKKAGYIKKPEYRQVFFQTGLLIFCNRSLNVGRGALVL